MTDHQLVLVDYLDAQGKRWFRCHCECGWKSRSERSNVCMGNGRRHLAAKRRAVRS